MSRASLATGRAAAAPGGTSSPGRAAMAAHREHSQLRLNMPALPHASWIPEGASAAPAAGASAAPGADPGAGPAPGS
ncbi:MAG TPA: hypothetical protein VGG35_05070 [Streptosporangiaceae bacterium]|jgi:hypothetical protein